MIKQILSALGYEKPSIHAKSGALSRDYDAQGPWTATMKGLVARQVQPRLYEALREAIPLIDGCINRLVTMDGILQIEGESDRVKNAIQQWADEVEVNDMQHGLQTFYTLQSNELYEQGLTLGEFILSDDQRTIERLNVGDSKGIYFRRPDTGRLETWYRPPNEQTGRRDGTDQIERILRNAHQVESIGTTYLREQKYRHINRESMIYAGFNVEADNPYGVSLIRSMEFVSKILLTIENATEQTWVRFGDPIFDVVYKTSNRMASDPTVLENRRLKIASTIAEAIKAKRLGKSVDIVQAIGKDDSIDMKIMGAGGQILELEQPVRHMEEQIIAKSGLPSWMVGRHWSTAERLAQRQGEIVLQESVTRFTNRKQGLKNIVATMLRAQGVSYKKDDWDITQKLPSLQDLVAKAQAAFLEAQTELMRNGGGESQPATVTTEESGKTVITIPGINPAREDERLGKSKTANQRRKVEGFAENNPALPKLETETIDSLVKQWQALYDEVIDALDLAVNETSAVFAYDDLIMTPKMQKLERELIKKMGKTDPVLARSLHDAWLIGVENGSAELGADQVVMSVINDAKDKVFRDSLKMVRNTVVRSMRDDIVTALADSEYDGLNPKDVARALKKRFDVHNYDWERLARSEISIAQAAGKFAQYEASDIDQYNYRHSKDSKVSAVCRKNAKNGPYKIGKGPKPVTDSHPNCRCTVTSFVPEEKDENN